MKINYRKYQLQIQKFLSRNLTGFPFFLLISIILYSFVVVKNNATGNEFSKPDGKDSLVNNQPKVDIKVNKKYDENGNLIQFDSSYSIVYSSPGVNTNIQFFNFDNDSIFNQFKSNPMFNDDFFKDFQSFGFDQNFFQMNAMNNIKQLEEMMNKMRGMHKADSLLIDPQQLQQPQPQPQVQPQKQNSTPNMITL